MKNNQIILPIILSLIFVFSLAGVVFYFQSQITTLRTSIVTPTVTPSPAWKTYTDYQFAGYEFKYPSDWTIENNEHDSFTFRLLSPETQKSKVNDKLSGLRDYYDIKITEIIPESLPKYLELGIKNISDITSSKYSSYFENSQSITFAGKKAVEAYEQGECRFYSIFIDSFGDILKISLPCNQAKESLTPIQKQILGSLKFMDYSDQKTTPTTSTETVNWQTYTNKEYGLEFKYPQGFELHENYTTPDKKNYYVSVMNPVATERYGFKDSDLKVEFYIATLDKPLTTEAYFEKILKESFSGNILKKDTKIVNSQKFGYIQWEGMGNGESYFTVHQNYGFSIAKYPFKTSRQNEFDQLLSTLKFTKPTSPTSEWQTYRNSQIGFEFQYPINFDVQETDQQIILWADKNRPTQPQMHYNPAIYFYIVSEHWASTIEDWAKIYKSSGEKIKTLTINGQTVSYFNGDGPGEGTFNYIFTRSKTLIRLYTLESSKTYGKDPIFSQILSSFKFTN